MLGWYCEQRYMPIFHKPHKHQMNNRHSAKYNVKHEVQWSGNTVQVEMEPQMVVAGVLGGKTSHQDVQAFLA
jgi:hypothetical protein